MILVRVGEHQAEDVAALLHQITDVRQDQVDAGELIVGEGHAEVDRDPLPPALVTEAVDREIHADLADPAERCENKFVGRAHRHRVFRLTRLAGRMAPAT